MQEKNKGNQPTNCYQNGCVFVNNRKTKIDFNLLLATYRTMSEEMDSSSEFVKELCVPTLL